MSLESAIAGLTQQAGLLMDLPQQVNAAAQAQITAMGAAYQAALASHDTTFYVDPVTGSDNNAGTSASPFATIGKAVSLTPPGGRCLALLKSNILLQHDVTVSCHLTIGSADGVTKQLEFQKGTITVGATEYRKLAGFTLRDNNSLKFVNIRVVMPSDVGYSAFSGAYYGCPIRYETVLDQVMRSLVFYACEISMPAAPFGSALVANAAGPLALYASTLTMVDQPIAGRWLEGVASGTSAATLNYLRTNLAAL